MANDDVFSGIQKADKLNLNYALNHDLAIKSMLKRLDILEGK